MSELDRLRAMCKVHECGKPLDPFDLVPNESWFDHMPDQTMMRVVPMAISSGFMEVKVFHSEGPLAHEEIGDISVKYDGRVGLHVDHYTFERSDRVQFYDALDTIMAHLFRHIQQTSGALMYTEDDTSVETNSVIVPVCELMRTVFVD